MRSGSVRPAASANRSSSRISRPTCCCPPTISAGPGSPRPRCLAGVGVTVRSLLETGEDDAVLRCTEHAALIHHVPKLLCLRGTQQIDDAQTEAAALARAVTRRGIRGRCAGRCRARYMACQAARAGDGQGVDHHPDLCGARLCRELHQDIARAHGVSQLRDRLRRQHSGRSGRMEDLAAAECRQGRRHAGRIQLVVFQQSRRGRGLRRVPAVPERRHRSDRGPTGSTPCWNMFSGRRSAWSGRNFCTRTTKCSMPACSWRHRALRAMHSVSPQADEPGYFGLALTQRNVIAVTGACMLMRRSSLRGARRLRRSARDHQQRPGFLPARAQVRASLWCSRRTRRLIHHEAVSRERAEGRVRLQPVRATVEDPCSLPATPISVRA